jgi:predicted metal-binding protein
MIAPLAKIGFLCPHETLFSNRTDAYHMTPTWITICDTCKREGWDSRGMERTDGEDLAERVETLAEGCANVRTRRHSCLMGCSNGCNVTIQAHGKLTYTLGNFAPGTEAAEAIVEYAVKHADSSSGQVPYRTWPEPIKGHFVTRHPPLPTE